MLKIEFKNGITINLNAEIVKEAVVEYLSARTDFFNESLANFSMEFEDTKEDDQEDDNNQTDNNEGEGTQRRRRRRTKQQIEEDAAKALLDQQVKPEVKEEVKVVSDPVELVQYKPRDLMQEAIDETPEEEEIQLELELPEIEIELDIPVVDSSKDDVLDLSQSIFG